jgi:hypothetical protein
MKSWYLILLLALAPITWAGGAGEEHLTPSAEAKSEAVDAVPHPAMPHAVAWPRVMGITILTLFVLAAAVGSLARVALPQEAKPDDGHATPHDTAAGGHH